MLRKKLIALGVSVVLLTGTAVAVLEIAGASAMTFQPQATVNVVSAQLVGNAVVDLTLNVGCDALPPYAGSSPNEGPQVVVNVQLVQAITRTVMAVGQANQQLNPDFPPPGSNTSTDLCNGSTGNVPQKVQLTITPNMNPTPSAPFSNGPAYVQIGVQACNAFAPPGNNNNNGPQPPQPVPDATCDGNGGNNGVVQIAGFDSVGGSGG